MAKVQRMPITMDCCLERLNVQLEGLRHIGSNWDGYNTPAPTEQAISEARALIHRMLDSYLVPTKVVPSGRGGVAIYFSNHAGKFADLQCPNQGDSVAVLSDRRRQLIRAFKVEPEEVDATIKDIRRFIDS